MHETSSALSGLADIMFRSSPCLISSHKNWSVVESIWLPSSNHWKSVCTEMRGWKSNSKKAGSKEIIKKVFCSTSLPLTSPRWVWSTIKLSALSTHAKQCRCQWSSATSYQINFRECRESNPGWLGGKRKRYLCAMPSPMKKKFLSLAKPLRSRSCFGFLAHTKKSSEQRSEQEWKKEQRTHRWVSKDD